MRSIDFPELSRRIPLAIVLDIIGWEHFRREPSGRRGYCPIHSPSPHRSRSFAAAHTGKWYCHVCEVGGDGLELFRRLTKLPRYEAAIALAKVCHVAVPYLKRQRGKRRQRNQRRGGVGGDAGGYPPALENPGSEATPDEPLPRKPMP